MPMTGFTAEKHVHFLVSAGDDGAILEFSGKGLSKVSRCVELPFWRIRSRLKHVGIPVGDATVLHSYERINGKHFGIPTVFLFISVVTASKENPLLRSLDVINKQGVRLLKLLGNDMRSTRYCIVGAEQEYFLIDEAFLFAPTRLDHCGRAFVWRSSSEGSRNGRPSIGVLGERVLPFMMTPNLIVQTRRACENSPQRSCHQHSLKLHHVE